jgi:hypothetical protein
VIDYVAWRLEKPPPLEQLAVVSGFSPIHTSILRNCEKLPTCVVIFRSAGNLDPLNPAVFAWHIHCPHSLFLCDYKILGEQWVSTMSRPNILWVNPKPL